MVSNSVDQSRNSCQSHGRWRVEEGDRSRVCIDILIVAAAATKRR
jgi:hypothetical protein